MNRDERAHLYRAFMVAVRRTYDPSDPVEVIGLFSRGDLVYIVYRNRCHGDAVHAHSRQYSGDRDAALWATLLPEPGPPGTFDAASGIHWEEPVPAEAVPDVVLRAVRAATAVPWVPAACGELVAEPATDLDAL